MQGFRAGLFTNAAQ